MVRVPRRGPRAFARLADEKVTAIGELAAADKTFSRRTRTAHSTAWLPGDALIEFESRFGPGKQIVLALPKKFAAPGWRSKWLLMGFACDRSGSRLCENVKDLHGLGFVRAEPSMPTPSSSVEAQRWAARGAGGHWPQEPGRTLR
jgi:hypothetical protein